MRNKEKLKFGREDKETGWEEGKKEGRREIGRCMFTERCKGGEKGDNVEREGKGGKGRLHEGGYGGRECRGGTKEKKEGVPGGSKGTKENNN